MAAQSNGSRVVLASVTLIVTALGVGTIYLPFIADKDKIRGLNEESDMSASTRREYERALREMSMAAAANNNNPDVRQQQDELERNNRQTLPNGMKHSNSMWARMNQSTEKK